MSYLVYARKYRPVTFESMIGQKHVTQTLQNAIKNDRIAQAYLFHGMRGVGKTTAARILAKALNCTAQDGPTPTPCNKCDSCLQINEGHSIDVQEIDGASNRGIDDVKSIRESVKYKALHSRYKVIIIDEVHQVTSQGFNALLKTLEEPPPNTVFIFATTEFSKVLATIVSRCQHFEFKKITNKDLVNHMIYMTKKENIVISDQGLALIADAADGSMRDAQSLLDQAVAFSGDSISDEDLKEILGTVSYEILFQFAEAIQAEKTDRIFVLVEKIMEKGYDLREFYKELIKHFHRLLIVKSTKKPGDILSFNEEEIDTYIQSAKNSSPEDILRYLNALQQAEQGLRYSSHPQIFLETTLVKLCLFKKLVPLKDILKRLEDMVPKAMKNPFKSAPDAYDPQEKIGSAFSPETPQKITSSGIGSEIPPGKQDLPSERSPGITADQKPKMERKKEREIDKAMEDPGIQKFMNSLKAQVVSVEPIKKGDK